MIQNRAYSKKEWAFCFLPLTPCVSQFTIENDAMLYASLRTRITVIKRTLCQPLHCLKI